MEAKDPKSKRYVYEPGLEDGITGDYLAELEKLGYRADAIPSEPGLKIETETESESEEKKEVEPPFGWVLLHSESEGRFPRMMIPLNEIYAICEMADGGTAVSVRHFTDRSTSWYPVSESFEEVIEKMINAWKGAGYAGGWKV